MERNEVVRWKGRKKEGNRKGGELREREGRKEKGGGRSEGKGWKQWKGRR